jgi:hypothetical protein
MSAPYKYENAPHALMNWVSAELEHVGRIVASGEPHLQKSYAMSTVNGMAHLKDALYEAIQDPTNARHKQEMLRAHNAVIRVMKHLIRDFDVDVKAIKMFNTQHVLSNLSYLKTIHKTTRKTRRGRKNHRNSRKSDMLK